MAEQAPEASILIAAWNSANTIARCIESFKSMPNTDSELILVAGGTDNTYEIATQYPGIKILRQKYPNKNAALNRALKSAKGEIILLTDSDCILQKKWVEKLLDPIIIKKEKVSTGSNAPLEEQLEKPFVLYQYMFTLFGRKHNPTYVETLDGKCAAIKKDVLLEIGGFDENVKTGTDFHLAKTLVSRGYKIRFVKDSVVPTFYPENFYAYIRQRSRWLRNNFLHGKRFNDRREVVRVSKTFATGVLMVTTPLLSLLFGPAPMLLWFAVFIIGLYHRLKLVSWARKTERKLRFGSVYKWIPLYTLVDYVAWFTSFVDLLIPWRRWKW